MNQRARMVGATALCLLAPLGLARPAARAAAPGEVEVVGLAVDAIAEPLGKDAARPRLGWRLQGVRRGLVQTACRVLGVRFERIAAGYTVYTVGSGGYRFVSRTSPGP